MTQEGRGNPQSAVPHTGHYIVWGGNALAHRLVQELVEQYKVPVVVLVPDRARDHAPRIELLPNVTVYESAGFGEEALVTAGIAEARGVALLDGTDQEKIHAALAAQGSNPGVRIVLRMFNQRLGEHIQGLVPNCSTLSGSATAAPAFANSALERPNSLKVGGRYLHIAFDEKIENPLCLVADRIDRQDLTRLRLLPDTGGRAREYIQLATRVGADGSLGIGTTSTAPEPEDRGGIAALQTLATEPPVRIPWWNRPRWWVQDALRYFTNARLRVILAVALSAVVAGGWVLAHYNHSLSWGLYLTLLDMAGAAQPDTPGQEVPGGAIARVAQVVITFCGITFVPVATAIAVDTLASGRRGLPRAPSARTRDHVVVVGLGNVGTRVATLIHETGIPVVCIERDPQARGIAEVRALGLPVLVGDARLEAQLRLARIQHSRALVAVTSDDAANLQSALEARAARPDIRVVLRLFDDDFARHVYASLGNVASRSVSYLAAPAFAAALMGREVLGTLSVFRHVLLIAELRVDERSGLVGQNIRNLEELGGVRVVAVRLAARPDDYKWNFADRGRKFTTGDRVVVAATRGGLARINAPQPQPSNGEIPGQGRGELREAEGV